MTSDLFDLHLDDDLSRGPKTPTPDEVPSHVRELLRVVGSHARQHQMLRRMIWAVIAAVAFGSLGVISAVATAAWSLGGRMERLESIAWRVERLERMEDEHGR